MAMVSQWRWSGEAGACLTAKGDGQSITMVRGGGGLLDCQGRWPGEEGAVLFEELGFYYIGPIDGHDLENLIPILQARPRPGP